jgi:hypothetical protein
MKITRSQLKSLIKEEMNRTRTLNEGNVGDAALVYAQLNPKSGLLGVLQSAWDQREFNVILRAGEKEEITPESAYEYFTTPGEGLDVGHTVAPMFNQLKLDDGMTAALDFAMKNGASFNIPGWDRMNSELPFDVAQFVLAKAAGQ